MREISFRGRLQCSPRVDSIEVAFEIEQFLTVLPVKKSQSARKHRTNVKRGQTLTYKCCIVKQTKKVKFQYLETASLV